MPVKVRTRLFLIVAVLLGASIVVSALLSRRATLIEVSAIVSRTGTIEDPQPVLDRVAAAVKRSRTEDLAATLAIVADETSRRVLVVDADRRVVAASSGMLAGARVKELSSDGTFIAELGTGAARSVVEVRGAPVRTVAGPDGRALTVLLLPGLDDGSREPPPPGTPLWVWTTIATGLIAVPMVFAVARRLLNPITALTDAAHRMQAGDLDVRVDVHGRDELAELAAAFNGMAARIAETERLRRQMVSDVAHELRSPVTNLRCTLESIQDGLAVPDRASIDALHEETLFLQRLVSDLQDLTLADAGQLALHVRPVDLRDVIRRAAAAMPATAGQPSVHIDCPERLPDVQGDRDRLEQVFRNILSNARTHTPADGRIEVRAWEDGRWIHVEVADTGAGIDAAHVAHVFDRFYRADTSRSRDTGGAGLGLAIAQQLVTAHGGDIAAASDGLGKGARFCVRLPVLQ